jgi:hypothetical protein
MQRVAIIIGSFGARKGISKLLVYRGKHKEPFGGKFVFFEKESRINKLGRWNCIWVQILVAYRLRKLRIFAALCRSVQG